MFNAETVRLPHGCSDAVSAFVRDNGAALAAAWTMDHVAGGVILCDETFMPWTWHWRRGFVLHTLHNSCHLTGAVRAAAAMCDEITAAAA
jgi:hypothetical protein